MLYYFCRLVRVSGSLITVSTFPTGPILKGFYSAITPYSYLGSTDAHITHTKTHALTQTHKFVRIALCLCTHCSHSHMHVHKHINSKENAEVPTHVGMHTSLYMMTHIHIQPQDQTKYPRLFRISIATTEHKDSVTWR